MIPELLFMSQAMLYMCKSCFTKKIFLLSHTGVTANVTRLTDRTFNILLFFASKSIDIASSYVIVGLFKVYYYKFFNIEGSF